LVGILFVDILVVPTRKELLISSCGYDLCVVQMTIQTLKSHKVQMTTFQLLLTTKAIWTESGDHAGNISLPLSDSRSIK
jgi:hypothetical protein